MQKNADPHATAQRKQKKQPKRSKLHYKNRWLISVNVVAALRRAGIDCDIIAPAELLPATERKAAARDVGAGHDLSRRKPH